MKTILFPTDFSEAANNAFVYALHFATVLDASITTIHAFQSQEFSGTLRFPENLITAQNNLDIAEFEYVRSMVKKLRQIQTDAGLLSVKMQHSITSGPTIPVILEAAEKEKADLIIMGTTGATGLKELLLGSIAGEVLENAKCPVLAVPQEAVFDGKIDHVGFTISFKEEEKEALNSLLTLFKTLNPAVYGIHIDLSHTEDFKHRLDDLKKEYALYEKVNFESVNGTDFEVSLFAYLEKKPFDLLAMVTHKRSFWEEFFEFSKAKALAYHSHVPILSFPQKRDDVQ